MSDDEDARYEDFITSNKKKDDQNKKPKVNKEVEDVDMSDGEEPEDSDTCDEDEDEEDDDDMKSDDEMKTENLSTHEKQLAEQGARIEEVERENLEVKSWTMQGEVNATKRPKNSALEVDLDWERNAKPPPVITQEVSQSIEELILKRISEGHFDDVQKAATLPSKAPREMKELNENQSKKGLGELYAVWKYRWDVKEHLAALANKLGSSLTYIHLSVKPHNHLLMLLNKIMVLRLEMSLIMKILMDQKSKHLPKSDYVSTTVPVAPLLLCLMIKIRS